MCILLNEMQSIAMSINTSKYSIWLMQLIHLQLKLLRSNENDDARQCFAKINMNTFNYLTFLIFFSTTSQLWFDLFRHHFGNW